VAEHLVMSEAAYTKYKRGESKSTVELVQKVSEFLKVDPLFVLSAQPGILLRVLIILPRLVILLGIMR